MALVVKDRVKVTTATTGTGTLTLGSAVAGFQAFSAVLSNADTTYYAIFESSTGAFEVGLGTYASPANTLARTTVLESSNAGSAVNLTAGDADVFITYAAEKSVYLDGAGSVTSAAGQIDISDFNNDAGYSTTIGTVTSVAGTAGTGISISGSPITTSGTLTITNTAPHIATNLTYSTASTTGTVNSSTGTNATLPAATTSLAGLLTGADKTKLNGIATGAQVNVATNLGYTTAASTGTVTSSTGTNATLPAATTTLAGLLTGADKTKLNGIATGAQVNVATNLGYTTAATTGTVTSSTGTNATLPAATTTLAGLLTGADKTKLNGIATGAQVNVATNLGITNGTTAGPIITSSTGANATFPTATATISGAITTGTQTFAGVKTFSSTITGSVSGNAGTATTLQTARTINGVSFNGSANITVADATKMPLAGGTFTGNVSYGNFSITDVQNITVDNKIMSTGDTNTFMHFHAADQFRVVTGNVERFEINNSAVTVAGNLILGTAGTATNRAVRADRSIATGSGLSGGGNLTANRTLSVDSTVIRTTGNQSMSGNKTFSTGIDVTGTAGLDMNNNDISGVDQIFHHGDTNTYIQFHAADQFRVVTGGAERFEINNSDVTVQSALKEKYVALSGTTPSIDVDAGGAFSLTTSGNTTFTFTAFTSALSCAFFLELTAGAGYTITWPASVEWAGGTAPDAPASGDTNIYVFWSRNGGTNWYGALSIGAAA